MEPFLPISPSQSTIADEDIIDEQIDEKHQNQYKSIVSKIPPQRKSFIQSSILSFIFFRMSS